jgi:uncharacterized protein with HEPN domain
MSKRPETLLVEDIWEAIGKIERFTKGIEADKFLRDEKTADAVVRNLEVIGEAVTRLPAPFRQQHLHVEWGKIIGLRHRIVHEYFGVDLHIIWQIVNDDIPSFKKDIARLRKEMIEG